jgi:hypothetical protein
MTISHSFTPLSDAEVRRLVPEIFAVHPNTPASAHLAQQIAHFRSQGYDPLYFLSDGSLGLVSPSLIISRKLESDMVASIRQLHIDRDVIFSHMRESDDPSTLKELARQVEAIEFELQANWGFDVNASFHEWYDVPKCRCPKLDNRERRGTGYSVIATDCPIHGGGEYVAGTGWAKNEG